MNVWPRHSRTGAQRKKYPPPPLRARYRGVLVNVCLTPFLLCKSSFTPPPSCTRKTSEHSRLGRSPFSATEGAEYVFLCPHPPASCAGQVKQERFAYYLLSANRRLTDPCNFRLYAPACGLMLWYRCVSNQGRNDPGRRKRSFVNGPVDI